MHQILKSLKIIIWYKKLSLDNKYLLFFDRVISELFGRNLYPQFFLDIEVGLKLFFICTLEMVVGLL